MQLERCYNSEFVWDEEELEHIEFNITDELKKRIDHARQALDAYDLRSVTIDVPDDAWDDATHDKMQASCAFDVSYISVFSHGGVYLYIQGKWDCAAQAEWAFNVDGV